MHKLTEDRDNGEGWSSKIRNYLFRAFESICWRKGGERGDVVVKVLLYTWKLNLNLNLSLRTYPATLFWRPGKLNQYTLYTCADGFKIFRLPSERKKINLKILLALKTLKTQTNSKDCSERQKVFCPGFFLRRFAGRIFIISTKFQRSKQKLHFDFLNKNIMKTISAHTKNTD